MREPWDTDEKPLGAMSHAEVLQALAGIPTRFAKPAPDPESVARRDRYRLNRRQRRAADRQENR